MAEHHAPDLIESICEGKGRRFHGCLCEFYTRLVKECQLLRQHLIDTFWEKGRCAYLILQIVEDGCMKTLKELYEGLPIDDAIDYDMQAVVQRLKQQHLESGFNLAVWHRYVHTTIYRELRKHLKFLPDKKSCGTCKHLSKSSSYICLKHQEQLNSLTGCPEYQLKTTLPEPPETRECPTCEHISRKSYFCYYLTEKRNKTDPICEAYSQVVSADFVPLCEQLSPDDEMYGSLHPDRLLYEISQKYGQEANSPEAQLIPQDVMAHVRQTLEDRIETEPQDSKRREMYERQYELFFALIFKLCDEIPEEDAIKTLACEYDMKPWTVKRDIKDVREFLKNVLDQENFLS